MERDERIEVGIEQRDRGMWSSGQYFILYMYNSQLNVPPCFLMKSGSTTGNEGKSSLLTISVREG